MTNAHRTILSLCDCTGAWPAPYRDAGYNVIQVDIKHGQDVRLLRVDDLPAIHGVLAAPPCTHFSSSGAAFWKDKDKDGRTLDALSIVDACLRIITAVNPQWWALENPVGRLKYWLGEPTFSFQPCDYGDPYTKKTLLWGNFTPPYPLFVGEDRSVEPITPRNPGHHSIDEYFINVLGRKPIGVHERGAEWRSITPSGFAKAFYEVNP